MSNQEASYITGAEQCPAAPSGWSHDNRWIVGDGYVCHGCGKRAADQTSPAHKLAASRLYLTQGDVDDLVLIASGLPLNANVVDLGAGTGTTAIAMLQTREDVRVWTYDISTENVEWARRNIQGFLGDKALDRWIGTVSDAGAAAGTFLSPVHALLHDASHEESAVFDDLSAWKYRLDNPSTIWVHDYDPMDGAAETYPGVVAAIKRFQFINPISRVYGRGIGWIGRYE